jgi:hypothetical protein
VELAAVVPGEACERLELDQSVLEVVAVWVDDRRANAAGDLIEGLASAITGSASKQHLSQATRPSGALGATAQLQAAAIGWKLPALGFLRECPGPG